MYLKNRKFINKIKGNIVLLCKLFNHLKVCENMSTWELKLQMNVRFKMKLGNACCYTLY